MEGAENVGTKRQMAWNHAAAVATDLRCLTSTVLAADTHGHRTDPAPLPLHERTSSEKNRQSGIRVVPYSPPRINAASVPADARKERKPRAGSPGSAANRRRRNWKRRRLSKERFDNGSGHSAANGAGRDGYGDDDGDATATAITSWRTPTSRPTSWASRGSHGSSWHVYPDDGSDSNTAPSGGQAMADGRTAAGTYEDDAATSWPEEDSWQDHENEGYAGSELGSALSTPTGGASSLASGALQTLPCVSGPRSATAATAAPSRVPSDAGRANLADARSAEATAGRATSHPFAHSLRPALGLPRQGHDGFRVDDAEPPGTSSHRRGAASPADPSSSPPTSPPILSLPQDLQTTGTSSALASPSSPSLSAASASSVPRPNSRRHNVIAVHADKTFSLVTRNADGLPPASVSSTTSPTGSFSDHGCRRPTRPTSSAAASRSLKSPPLSFATSTIRSSDSHERLFSFSDAFGSDHRSSSPLTSITSANPSRYSNHPAFSLSPGASTLCLDDEPAFRERPSAPTTHHPQDDYPIGNVHTASTAPDWKSKGKAKAPANATGAARGATGVDPTERPPIKKASFASDHSDASLATSTSLSFSASVVSIATNYKIYSRSSPRLGPATAARSASTASAAHDSADDTVSLPSSSGSTNVVVLGVSSPAAPPLPVLRRSADPDQTFASLASYPSIASFASGISSFSDSGSTPNVVLLGTSSPPAPLRYRDPPQVDADNSAIFGGDAGIPSSPPLRPLHPDTTTSSFYTSDSEPNYVLHNAASAVFDPPPSSSSAASARVVVSRQPRPVYSQESLVVPPLQPLRHHWSSEKLRLYKARSRESLRHAASLQSLRHAASLQSLRHAASIKSLTSVFGQEAASTFFAGQAFLSLSIPPVPVVTAKSKDLLRQQRTLQPKRKPLPLPAPPIDEEKDLLPDRTPRQALRHLRSWDSVSSPPSTSSFSASPPPSPALPQQPQQAIRTMADGHTHQWSSQLSTVASESDGASVGSRAVSQSLSVLSGAPSSAGYVRGDVNGMGGSGDAGGAWRLSAGAADSVRSHNRTSASSSLRLQLDDTRSRHSRGDSLLLERPQQLYFRYANSASPSAAGGSTGPPAPALRMVRDHDEHGDGLADLDGGMAHQPSRTGLSGFFTNSNNSLRNLHSSASSRSLGGVGFPVWARVYYGSGEHRALSRSASVSDLGQGDDDMERASLVGHGGHTQLVGMEPVFAEAEGGPGTSSMQRPLGVRKMTSSVWSPHLRRDRHAAHFRVWEPPSVTWSAGTRSVTDRRNMQVICFTVGFICPFFWMLAAVLPLPLHRQGGAEKSTDEGDGEYGVPAVLTRRMVEANEMRFQSARWWRMLNRVMSVFGLLILGAVAALVVVGVRDHWGR